MIDCIIVGGGVIGLLSARVLSEAGLRVTLLDSGRLGREASWAAGGILSPLYPWALAGPVDRLAARSQALYPALVQALHAATGIDPEWTPSGMLVLDADAGAAAQWAARGGIDCRHVDAAQAVALEPALGQGACGDTGAWLPAVAQLRNPALLQALAQELAARGVTLREGFEVEQVLHRGGRITGVAGEGEHLSAPRVVIAAGAWSANLLAPTGLDLAVAPVRGEMLMLRTDPGTVRRIVLARSRYIIPRRDGRVLVGSTVEAGGFSKHTTAAARRELLAFAGALMPCLAAAALERQWAGLRPGSPDGVPFIGAHPAIEGLFVNTGHFRNGITLAPASAELLGALVLGGDTRIDPQPYRAGRETPHAA